MVRFCKVADKLNNKRNEYFYGKMLEPFDFLFTSTLFIDGTEIHGRSRTRYDYIDFF